MSLVSHLSVKQAYVIVFVILAFWAVFAYSTMQGVIAEEQKYAGLINVSGKQRMLSQRTALLAYKYLKDNNPLHHTDLEGLIVGMEEEHRFLTQKITSPTLHEIYFGPPALDAKVRAYLMLLKEYSAAPSEGKIQDILSGSNALLPLLNDAVSLFETESDAKITVLQQREQLILAGTLTTLLLEYLLLVRPLSSIISRKTEELEEEVRGKTKALQALFQQAQTNHDLLDAIVQNAPIPIFYKNAQGVYEKVNAAFCETFGFTPDEITDKTIRDIASGGFANVCDANDKKLYEDPEHQQVYEYSVPNRKNHRTVEMVFYKKALLDERGEIVGIVGAILDVTDKKEHERQLALRNEQLKMASETDPLTKVGNRRLCEQTLRFHIALQEQQHDLLTILLIDLDDFKHVNDTYGHNGGDEVLQLFASTARGLIREGDFIGRWGGEEFLIICPHSSEHDGIVVANKICDTVREIGFSFQSNISVSIGVAQNELGESACELLISKADIALYEAKHRGKDQALAYSMVV